MVTGGDHAAAGVFEKDRARTRGGGLRCLSVSVSLPILTQSHYPSIPPPVEVRLVTLQEHPCPYLPGRLSRSRAFLTNRMHPMLYHDFMDASFRRSGTLIYQPVCRGCRACQAIRVPVERFQPSKSQRRCGRKNQDLSVSVGTPESTDEKYEMYVRYQTGWHNGSMNDGREGFEAFLYESPVQTLEFTYRDRSGTLLAVGICDVCPRSLSSVYFYFDPDHARRGLGTFGVLSEIDFARQRRIPYYYLGYWVDGCPTMQYKSSYHPCEILHTDGQWRPHW